MGFIGEFIQNLPQWRRPQLRCPRTHSNTTTTYNPDNTVSETNGDQTYRVSHTYDYAQRQISMTTYGTTTATTTWQYSSDRGFLLAKRDAANKGATYTYTAAGRLASRTWGRSSVALPKVTEYSYENGGRMISTNYWKNTTKPNPLLELKFCPSPSSRLDESAPMFNKQA